MRVAGLVGDAAREQACWVLKRAAALRAPGCVQGRQRPRQRPLRARHRPQQRRRRPRSQQQRPGGPGRPRCARQRPRCCLPGAQPAVCWRACHGCREASGGGGEPGGQHGAPAIAPSLLWVLRCVQHRPCWQTTRMLRASNCRLVPPICFCHVPAVAPCAAECVQHAGIPSFAGPALHQAACRLGGVCQARYEGLQRKAGWWRTAAPVRAGICRKINK